MLKVIVKDVNYDFTYDDINYDEFEVYEGSEKDYIEEQKELLKEQLGTHFEYLFDRNEYNIYDENEKRELLYAVANSISDDVGWCCEITDYIIVVDYNEDKDTQEILKERGKFKEFYVMHYNSATGNGDYDNLVFKTWKQALKEFENTEPRDKDDIVEIIFSPEDEDYSDNMEMIMKCY